MPKVQKKPSLTEAEIKALITTYFETTQSRQERLNERIKRALGQGKETKADKQETLMVHARLMDMIIGVIARRLKRNRRTVPLLAVRDFDKLVPSMVQDLTRNEELTLNPEMQKMAEDLVKGMLKSVFEMMETSLPPRKDPYMEFWRWITTVFELARECGLPPIEYVASTGAPDAITRRLMTKTQYIASTKRTMKNFMDTDAIKRLVINPLFEALGADCDEAMRREIEQDIEEKLMPEIRQHVERAKSIFETWLGEETLRIYATN